MLITKLVGSTCSFSIKNFYACIFGVRENKCKAEFCTKERSKDAIKLHTDEVHNFVLH
jgi:hypothetical protein